MRGMKKHNTKNQYSHLDQAQRDRIQALRESGHTQAEIARILGVRQSTISRELQRNCRKARTKHGARDGPYEASLAQHKAYVRRHYAKWQWKKIDHDQRLEAYIIEKLKLHWNPDEISGRMREDKEPFCASKTAIYEWMRTSKGDRYCKYLYSGRHRVKPRRGTKTKRTLIPHRISIAYRPLGASNKSRYGHWEGDTMVSGKKTASKAAASVAYERKAKFIEARRIRNLKPTSHNNAMQNMLANKKALSLSQDNGIENTKHQELGMPTFFCDPYSSWQKGGVEHAIKMLRRFIPKRADLNDYTNRDMLRFTRILNNKPRKSLGYKTPYEVMMAHNVFKNSSQTTNEKYALRG